MRAAILVPTLILQRGDRAAPGVGGGVRYGVRKGLGCSEWKMIGWIAGEDCWMR